MREMTYDIPSWLIAVMLIIAMAAAMEIGYRVCRRTRGLPTAVSKRSVNAMQSSILLILALLLAFTLSIALQRYDQRSDAVVDEANAIGTVYLRTQLLRQPARDELQPMVRDYLAMRVKSAGMKTVEGAPRDAVLDATEQAQGALWAAAVRAAQADPSPVTSGLFVQALNDMIDSYGRRDAGLNRHVPEGVLFLLYAALVISGGVVGLSSGLSGHRPSRASSVAMVMLLVAMVFLIIDLDRPRRGLIRVSHAPLIDLLASIDPKPAQPR
jgi:FtsH-binding integral membrane protein